MLRKTRKTSADVVVIGAGIAGCSAAFELAKQAGTKSFRLAVVDELEPLQLTSCRGTFAYRNWWPSESDDTMMNFMTRSIDLYDELAHSTNNIGKMSRNGYLFATRNPTQAEEYRTLAKHLETLGGGSLRVHGKLGYEGGPQYAPTVAFPDLSSLDGTDLVLGKENIDTLFPHLKGSDAIAALHVRRCGWFSAPHKLGQYWLEKSNGEFVKGLVTDILRSSGRVTGVKVNNHQGESHVIETNRIVLAAGPRIQDFEKMIAEQEEFQLPVTHELHARAVFDDINGVIDKNSPFSLWSDPIESIELKPTKADGSDAVNGSFPQGVHVRPFPNEKLGAIWTYDVSTHARPKYPVQDLIDSRYGEICMHGLSSMIPKMKTYLDDQKVINSIKVDGGYYCKTLDNRPLIGTAVGTIDGIYIHAAMSGFGFMAAPAAGELLASHVLGDPSEFSYAQAFLPDRFANPAYVQQLNDCRAGQM